MKLLLDFVPNHLGFDHPWTVERPQLFVQNSEEVPGTFPVDSVAGKKFLAHGKDPHFYPWIDTVQVDYRRADARAAMLETLQSIAARCDGVRCDMAMLLLNDVFAGTWAHFPAQPGSPRLPPSFERRHPGREAGAARGLYFSGGSLLGAGGAGCNRSASISPTTSISSTCWSTGAHRGGAGLSAGLAGKLHPRQRTHFLENHDEERIAPRLSLPEHAAAALLILGLPGMRFLHEGQLNSARRIIFRCSSGRRPVDRSTRRSPRFTANCWTRWASPPWGGARERY